MGYRYKVVVDQFPVTDKVVDVLGVQSTHIETVVVALNMVNGNTLQRIFNES